MKALIIGVGKDKLGSLSKDEPRLLGLSLSERMIRTAKQVGIDEFVIILPHSGKEKIKLADEKRLGVKIIYRECEEEDGVCLLKAKEVLNEKFVVLKAEYVFDHRILKELARCDMRSSVIVVVDRKKSSKGEAEVLEKEGRIVNIGKDVEESNCIATGIFLCLPKIFSYIEEAVKEGKKAFIDGIDKAARNKDAQVFDITQINPYIPSMRKETKPFWIKVSTREDLTRAKKLLIENASKGRNDLLATYVNKPIENFIVARLANTPITPNQITTLTNIIAYISTFLFIKGYLLAASLLTFIVSFLDGTDGKLSRIKLASSNTGKMEHAFDFLFEHSWYIALAIYLSRTHGILAILLSTFVILFDSLFYHCEQTFEKVIKERPLTDYGRAEQLFRKFDGRKNSYIIFILIGVLLNAPFWALVAVSIWSLVSAIFYCSRTILHLYRTDRKLTPRVYRS